MCLHFFVSPDLSGLAEFLNLLVYMGTVGMVFSQQTYHESGLIWLALLQISIQGLVLWIQWRLVRRSLFSLRVTSFIICYFSANFAFTFIVCYFIGFRAICLLISLAALIPSFGVVLIVRRISKN